MVRILKKIASPQEDMMRFNQNFDAIAQDLADRSGQFSSIGSTGAIALNTGNSVDFEVDVIDNRNIYEVGELPVIPRWDMFVDNDGDFTYSYPRGSNLSPADVHGIGIEVSQSLSVLNGVENEKATLMVKIKNASGTNHTFYFYVQAFYVPSPDVGVALRAS